MPDSDEALVAEIARLRAELAAVQERAQRLERAVQAAPIAINCVAGETGRYVFANEAFARHVGKPLCDVLESDPYQVWMNDSHPDDIGAELEAVGRIAKGEIDRYQGEKRAISRGEPCWTRVEVVASRESSGRLDYVTVYLSDIHEQKMLAEARQRLESQLRQTQKLDALGKLAGGVSHDFNNRLLIIIGYAELMKGQLPADSPLREQLDMVLTSAQRAAELTRQLLAYSRRQVLKPEAFDVNDTVDRMRSLLERVIGDRIELCTALGASYPVFADPGQIEQAILNLAIHARDAMPGGGRLTLETRDVTLGQGRTGPLPPGDYVEVVVSDSGTGIPPDVIPHIFEPFFTTKAVGHGTGLGLSMVEGIVNQSGGAVAVTTREGEGTCFAILLPRAQEVPRPRYVAVDAPLREVSFETVLVCDDDDGVRRLLSDVLRLRAYRILEARNGRHALEVAAGHAGPIELLVTDLVMPELGGIELASALRERHPTLRVLYLSGYTEDADRLSAPLEPSSRFLAKPFMPGDLTRAVIALLER